jgi:hypothetical protein
MKKVKDEIKAIIQELEKDYDMDYADMYDCYLKNDYPLDYHIGVSYVEGMDRAVKLMETKNETS